MLNTPPIIPLKTIVQKLGISLDCISHVAITKVYQKNSQDYSGLYIGIKSNGWLSEDDANNLIDCLSIIIAAPAKNNKLNLTKSLGFSKTLCDVSQS